MLPTHDREDPLANVNAYITVFIAEASSLALPPFLSLSLSSSTSFRLSLVLSIGLSSTHKYIRTMRR